MSKSMNPWALVGKVVKTYNLGIEGKRELLSRLKERFGDNMYKWNPGQIVNQAKMVQEEMEMIETSKGIINSIESQSIIKEINKNREEEIIIDMEW